MENNGAPKELIESSSNPQKVPCQFLISRRPRKGEPCGKHSIYTVDGKPHCKAHADRKGGGQCILKSSPQVQQSIISPNIKQEPLLPLATNQEVAEPELVQLELPQVPRATRKVIEMSTSDHETKKRKNKDKQEPHEVLLNEIWGGYYNNNSSSDSDDDDDPYFNNLYSTIVGNY